MLFRSPLLDGATVGGILDVEIGRVEGDDVGCTYTTPDSTIMSDGFVTVNVRYDRGGLALIRSAFPDGETLQVDGRDAWWSSSITILWVDRGGDDTTTVQFVMSADEAATLEHAVAIVQALDAAGG